MTSSDLILAATAGAVCLALCATLWAMAQRRRFERHTAHLTSRADALEYRLMDSQGAAEAFDTAVIAIHEAGVHLVSGEDALVECARILDAPADAQAVVSALVQADPDYAHKLTALFERGAICAFEARGPRGGVMVEGRAAGTRAWLRLAAAAANETGLPDSGRFAAFMDGLVEPA